MTGREHGGMAVALATMLERISGPQRVQPGSVALANAALIVADNIAIAVGTAHEPEVRQAQALVRERSRLEEASLLGGEPARGDRFLTASANALAMTTAEFDGGAQHTPCHAGLYIVPALLAESEARGATCADLLGHLVQAYEITVRIAGAFKSTQGSYPNLYTHARFAAIGAACGRALAEGMDWRQLRDVIGIAATMVTAGPRNHLVGGAMVRNVWPAAATQNGMMSVEWARWGELALPTSLTDVFCGVLGFSADPATLLRPQEQDWEIDHNYHRVHACHLFCSALIECLIDIRGQLERDGMLDGIETIAIAIHDDAVGLTEMRPGSTLAARFSMPHVAAATLTLGHAGLAAFNAKALSDPAIVQLRRKVRVTAISKDRYLGAKWPAAVEIHAGGRLYSAARGEAMGGHGTPHPRSAILDKIDGLTRADWPGFANLARRLIDLDPEILTWPVAQFIDKSSGRGAYAADLVQHSGRTND